MTTTPVTIGEGRGDEGRGDEGRGGWAPSDISTRMALAARVTAAARAEMGQRPDDLSMRAVARRAGIDPGELSRLVESREQLITNVMFEIAFDAHAAIGPAVEGAAGTGCRPRILALARAFRRWALASPADFWILLGPRRRGGVDRAGAVRAMRWFYGPAIDICRAGIADGDIDLETARLSDRSAHLVHPVFLEMTDDLDPRLVSLFLSLATGLHGYLMLEACGQLTAVFGDLDRAFDAHMRTLLDGAGVR